MKTKLLAAFLCMALLSSCSISTGLEELLQAPRLNQQQADVYDALEATVNLPDIVYKYPQNGEYRSPYVFYDLDGDGVQEAIVFYAFASEPGEVRVKVLRKNLKGGWSTASDLYGKGSQIDFVRFEHITSLETWAIVIGWVNGPNSYTLGVYSFDGIKFKQQLEQPYVHYTIEDFDGDGLVEIAAVIMDGEESFALSLFSGAEGYIRQDDMLPLSRDAIFVHQMVTGRLWNGRRAVYVDEAILGGGATATEVIQVWPGQLELLAGDSVDDELSMDSYVMTFREEEVFCADLDGDGKVEVPQLALLVGQNQSDEIQSLYLTQFMQLGEEGFEITRTAAINQNDGYLLYFPDDWLDYVTVVRQPEISEWRFYVYDNQTEQTGAELLRIRRYSVNDYQDQFTQDYLLLGEKGMFRYYGYIPATTHELSISQLELERLFLLL